MELMPEGYAEYLLSEEIGFASCEKIADDLHEKKGKCAWYTPPKKKKKKKLINK